MYFPLKYRSEKCRWRPNRRINEIQRTTFTTFKSAKSENFPVSSKPPYGGNQKVLLFYFEYLILLTSTSGIYVFAIIIR